MKNIPMKTPDGDVIKVHSTQVENAKRNGFTELVTAKSKQGNSDQSDSKKGDK